MIIEIESVYGDKILHGRKLCERGLADAVKALIREVGEERFASEFCLRYGYEEVPYSSGAEADILIDLDTHMILKR